MTTNALAGGDRAREVARDLRRVAAQLDAAWQLAREVGQSHKPGHTRSCRLCTALIDAETSGLWSPEAPDAEGTAKAPRSRSPGRTAAAASLTLRPASQGAVDESPYAL